MTRRGVYRGVYSSLIDDPDYQALSAPARLVLLTLRLCREAGAAAIFRLYPAVLIEQTGISPEGVEGALEELASSPTVERPWIHRDGPVVWVRNALRYDPLIRLADGKHRKSVEKAVQALPRLPIVATFCRYYGIECPFDDPGEGPGRPFEDPSLPSTDSDSEVLPDSDPEAEGRSRDRVGGSSAETLNGQPTAPRLRRVQL